MRFVVAPQEFKGSLTAVDAAAVIASGVRDAVPDATVDEAPMSDGGPGLVDALLAARGGERIETVARDPLMRPVRATWARMADGSAAIEMAAASGLTLLAADELDPLRASTYGTGQLILAALDRGCERIIVGVGGSATVDAGAGAMQALGARLLDAHGVELPRGGGALADLARIDLTGVDARLRNASIVVASDVTNTLCGEQGAARVFGPQKGASPADVGVLDAALARFAEVASRDHGVDLLTVPGSGAAGGLGAGLMLAAGARLEPGFAIVAEATGLDRRIAATDVVITGEGRLDAQTPFGKTAAGVARIARAHGKRVGVIAGTIREDFDRADGLFDAVLAVAPQGMSVEEAMRRAGELLRLASAQMARELAGLVQSDRR
jgi:glycerate kinase